MAVNFLNKRGAWALLVIGGLALACAMYVSSGFSQKNSSQQGKGSKATMKNEQQSRVVYAALGDSTGVGVGAKEGGYVARLFKRIERERPHSSLKNFCVSGSTTADVLREQVGPSIAARPTIITLAIGINDIGHGLTVEKFASNYEEIVSRLKAGTSAPIVVTTLPDVSLAPAIPPYLRPAAHERVIAFNRKIKEIAGRHDLHLVDAYDETDELISAHPEFFSADGFHPSDVGYEYWAKTMWPTVKAAISD
ncbi:MAG TPA: SGNH/GDSL hydrolase family protein [Pyrinomonadaceae bacterium]|jgi:lysophospholipase L1-like esterase